MAADSVVPRGQSAPSGSQEGELEERYTDLLERRIAQLQSVIVRLVSLPAGKEKSRLISLIDGDKIGRNAAKTSRYRIIVRQFNKTTATIQNIDVNGLDLTKEGGEVAFIFRRSLSDGLSSDDVFSEVDVEALGLRLLLKECIGPDYPGLNFAGDIVNLAAPFAPLVHNWAKLLQASSTQPDDDETKRQAREDLGQLLKCVTAVPELESYFKSRESNLQASITTYDAIWTLFAPKTKIVAKLFLNQVQVLEVTKAPIPQGNPASKDFKVLAWCWDWNGKEMIKVYYNLPIDRFSGAKDIDQLFCYPLHYHKDESKEVLCEKIRARGARYNEIVRSKSGPTPMYMYDGVALSEGWSLIRTVRKTHTDRSTDGEDNTWAMPHHPKIVTVHGAFIVDPAAFLQFGPGFQMLGETEPLWTGEIDSKAPDGIHLKDATGKEYSEEELLLYPPRLLGYSTKEKTWGQFSVDHTFKVPERNISLFQEKLQLDEIYKSMIQALVEEHGDPMCSKEPGQSRAQVEDFITDKGKSLVLLFHGPPGVGKTLTAETIAEATGKPLLVVSVAEIGIDASKAERNLKRIFYLAAKWDAIILVDEADVFLEARSMDSDPNRNALVSVLLHVLEYSHGIIILTTNRITSFDIAVQSRIHLAIRYDDLTRQQKGRIFQQFLDQLKPDSIADYVTTIEFVEEYGVHHKLNGRQIRNIVSSALSLARSLAKNNGDDPRMTLKHLKTVLRITQDFQEQFESITTDTRLRNEVQGARR